MAFTSFQNEYIYIEKLQKKLEVRIPVELSLSHMSETKQVTWQKKNRCVYLQGSFAPRRS